MNIFFLLHLDPLVDPRPPARSFSPRAVKNIKKKVSSLGVVRGTPDALYETIIAVFLEHSQERRAPSTDTTESWTNLIPAPMRLELTIFHFYDFNPSIFS